MPNKNKQNNIPKAHHHDSSGIFVPAGLFLGMGIGYLTNNFIAWLFIGLGVGFVVMALTRFVKKK